VLGRSEVLDSAVVLVNMEVTMEEYARSALLLTVKDVIAS
jgi:hypothetical protein